MVYVAECKLQELVCENCPSICKAKETMVCEDRPQPHRSSVQNSLVAETAETSMAMYNLDAFAYDNIAEDGEEGEHRGKRGLAVDDEEGHIVDLQTIGEVSHTCSAGVRVSDDYDLVSTVDEFLR